MDHFSLKRPHFFFTTAPLPCPYISGRMERKIVTELNGNDAEELHESLSKAGFRRSHSIAYTPACPGCNACVPVRVIADQFVPSRSMRRVIKSNQHLTATRLPARAHAEHFALFARYQASRHSGGDMALMGYYDYRSMVEDSPIDTYLIEFRNAQNDVVAVCLIDQMIDGLSAVYSFFTPDLDNSSLGTYIILWLIAEALRLDLPYVYLGYWISESRKMAYKTRFQPLQAFGPGGWHPLIDGEMISAPRHPSPNGLGPRG
jgi:leucyl-tRNA---protein transferase